ncbi:hypothetical protein J3330_06515 [Leuconostoc mesenteroides]|uniref:hypothetical protein n=1 Tax=Leuconostoc mesenteroides TaxID=1245 RepID=UPI001CBB8E8A|nr:hypothetical protein [Leuconostoc mesenteroides]MBZ1518785.1 hypothetical protein [Leuconostoc mesenteroides]MBZ1520980.1 hypothetical protein [Leuconostoc mesenteroides]MBZ1522962.1 hypothetical protein [Leuconostoc mesenteroides]
MPRWLADELTRFQTKDYSNFKINFSKCGVNIMISEKRDEEKFRYLIDNAKTIDLAIALVVWEIEE